MTLVELLKAKGIDDDTVKAIQEEMKANKIFTASEVKKILMCDMEN